MPADLPKPRIIRCPHGGHGYDFVAPDGFVLDIQYPQHDRDMHIYLKKV